MLVCKCLEDIHFIHTNILELKAKKGDLVLIHTWDKQYFLDRYSKYVKKLFMFKKDSRIEFNCKNRIITKEELEQYFIKRKELVLSSLTEVLKIKKQLKEI